MQTLNHVTVLDLSQGIAGPAATALLASQGARVIKVEPPAGDWIRGAGAQRGGQTANAIVANLRKQSLAVDATRPEGRDLLLDLAARSQVLVQNFRPGVADRLGLGFDAVHRRNPALVYASISGFGDSGPRVAQAATDSVLQAYTGLSWANRAADGTPRRVPLLLPDNATALYAAQAITSALVAQALRGEGAHLKLSLLECCVALQAAPIVDAQIAAQAPPVAALLAPAGDYRVADGWVQMGCLNQGMFERLAALLDRADWLADTRFATQGARKQHAAAINAEVAALLAPGTVADWLQRLTQADVLCSAIHTHAELLADTQVQHMGYTVQVDQPPYGTLTLPQLPGRPTAPSAAPTCGEHSVQVLRDCGVDEARIGALLNAGVVLQANLNATDPSGP